jgi:hypothetical protein
MKIILVLLIIILIPIVEAEECQLKLHTNKEIYQNREKIQIYNILDNKTKDFTIEYWIEDAKGSVIKEKTKTKNLNPKQYTPNLNQTTILIIKNKLGNCQNEKNITVQVNKPKNDEKDINETQITVAIYESANIKAKKINNNLIIGVLSAVIITLILNNETIGKLMKKWSIKFGQ